MRPPREYPEIIDVGLEDDRAQPFLAALVLSSLSPVSGRDGVLIGLERCRTCVERCRKMAA